MKLDPALLAAVRRQHGLVTLDLWQAHGGARSSFYRLANEGQLDLLAPGVGVLPGTAIGPLQRIAAGVSAFGPGVMASHASAAWLWGAPVEGANPVELITTRSSHRTTRPGYRIHRPSDRDRLRPVRRRLIAATTPYRTLLDIGASRPDDVLVTLESFLRDAHVTAAGVRSMVAQRRRRGRPGVGPLVASLEGVRAPTDSELEAAARALFDAAGVTGWVFHPKVEGWEVDFCFADERVVVEVDGWSTHGASRVQWERDREKDLALTALGWVVLRLSWRMVVRCQPGAMARLQSTLRRRR